MPGKDITFMLAIIQTTHYIVNMTDATMLKYWRRAVRVVRGDNCVWPGCPQRAAHIHHFVHRKHKLLKYDVRNGLPLCVRHHNGADRTDNKRILSRQVDMGYLNDLKRVGLKQFLANKGMTWDDFCEKELVLLKKLGGS
jgi:hypothetical protein